MQQYIQMSPDLYRIAKNKRYKCTSDNIEKFSRELLKLCVLRESECIWEEKSNFTGSTG